MAIKTDLQYQLKEIGYILGPFTSKDTLSTIRLLHSIVLEEQNINVAKLGDIELRQRLIQLGLTVGPITNFTRAIYQRKLLETLANRSLQGQDDELEDDEYNTFNPNILQKKSTTSTEISKSQDFTYVEPLTIRNDYKKTTTSSKPNTEKELNELRPRIQTKSNEIKKATQPENENDQMKVEKKGMGIFSYIAITIIVALIVFFVYLRFEN